MRDNGPASPVMVIGAGLIGTSIGLRLRRLAVDVHLEDTNSHHLASAVERGAGTAESPSMAPELVVIAVPPLALGPCIVQALERWPQAAVTDVGSVKVPAQQHVLRASSSARCYVGSHPLAGSAESGPAAASADLFQDRPWALVPHDESSQQATARVTRLIRDCGGLDVPISATNHDMAVANTSHLPYLLSVLMASRMTDCPPADLSLIGPGLQGLTRTAASDPDLWQQILLANADNVASLLVELGSQLHGLVAALRSADAEALHGLLTIGVQGTAAIQAARENQRT